MSSVERPRCKHCRGTGYEPEREYTDQQWAIVDQLVAAGEERARYSATKTLEGTTQRERVYADIRALTEHAREVQIPKVVIADAIGVSRTQLDNILRKS